jgi:hypothetical protein
MQDPYGSDKGNSLPGNFGHGARDGSPPRHTEGGNVWHCQRVEIIEGSVFQGRLA